MPCLDASCCLAGCGNNGLVVLTVPAGTDFRPFVCRLLAFRYSDESSEVKVHGSFYFDRFSACSELKEA